MKITICGSIAFYDEMLAVKNELEEMSHEVKLPTIEVKGVDGKTIPAKEYYQIRKTANENIQWVWDRKEEVMMDHFNRVVWADSILVLNYDKNNIKGYVGGNTLMEMGLAFFLKKKVFLLNSIPELSYKEEILGLKPIVINGDLTKIYGKE